MKALKTSSTEGRRIIIDIFKQLREIFIWSKIYGYSYESVDDEKDDDGQPDTTDMKNLLNKEENLTPN